MLERTRQRQINHPHRTDGERLRLESWCQDLTTVEGKLYKNTRCRAQGTSDLQ